jgi:magnesium transporter
MALEGEITILYRPSTGTLVDTAEPGILGEALADTGGLLWLDLHVRSEADGAILEDPFHFHPLTIEDSVADRLDAAKIDDHGEYIFVVVQALAGYVEHEELQAVEVDLYLGPNYVVSCHRASLPAIDQFKDHCRRDEALLARGSDWLLHGILDAIVDEYLPIVDAVDETIDDLEARVIENPDRALLQRIMMVKRNALRLRRATLPQREIIARLDRGEFPKLIRPETAIYFRDIYDHLVHIEYLVEALRDLADGALQTYLSVISNRLNEVMKILTVAFVPLTIGTLISGIYGMNLTEGFWPPSDSGWGFAMVVAAILVTGLGVLAYFRSRRWI